MTLKELEHELLFAYQQALLAQECERTLEYLRKLKEEDCKWIEKMTDEKDYR